MSCQVPSGPWVYIPSGAVRYGSIPGVGFLKESAHRRPQVKYIYLKWALDLWKETEGWSRGWCGVSGKCM